MSKRKSPKAKSQTKSPRPREASDSSAVVNVSVPECTFPTAAGAVSVALLPANEFVVRQ